MSEVIRDAVVRLRIELNKAKLESPELLKVSRAYSEQAKSAREVSKAVVETQKVTREATHAHEEFGQRSFKAFAHAAHGAMTLARGIALMSASGEEDAKKLIESLVKIEAAVAIAKGAASMGKLAAEFGPVGIAIAAVTTAVSIGVAIWHKYAAAEEEAKKKAHELKEKLDEVARAETGAQSARQARLAAERIGATSTESEKFRRIEEERARLVRERGGIQDEMSKSRIGRDLDKQDPSERQRTLKNFGNVDPQELENQKTFQQRLLDNAKAQLEITKQQFERDKKLWDDVQKRFGQGNAAAMDLGMVGVGAPLMGAVSSIATGQAVGSQAAAFETEAARALQNAQQFFDGFVKMIKDADERIGEINNIQKQLDAAYSK